MVALRSPYLLSNARLRDAAAGGRPLSEGEASPAVAQMKAALLDLGFRPTGGAAPAQVMDGTFGTGTTDLVKAFQRDKGLAPTGALDATTLLAADQALAVKAPVPLSNKGRPGRQATTPPPQAVGRKTPPIGKPDPYQMYYEDGYYTMGTEDPTVSVDSGAGVWNSKSKTFSAIVLAESLSNAMKAGAGDAFAGPHATRHMKHYLANSGSDYRIDLEVMIRTVPSARAFFISYFGKLQDFLRGLPQGRYDFTARRAQPGYNSPNESRDWYFAVGSYITWAKGRASVESTGVLPRYSVDLTYRFFDRYNWDHGKSTPLIAGITISDDVLAEFHRQGLAREFNCWGAVSRRFTWVGDGPLSEALILQHGGR